MVNKICDHCKRKIGIREYSFLYLNRVVCRECKVLLDKELEIDDEHESATDKSQIAISDTPQEKHVSTMEEAPEEQITYLRQEKSYAGISRKVYFFGILILAVANILIITNFVKDYALTPYITIGLSFIVLFPLVISRLHNICRSGWWSLLLLIPGLNIFFSLIPCLILPEDYNKTRKLDVPGKILYGLFIGILIATILAVIIQIVMTIQIEKEEAIYLYDSETSSVVQQ